MRKLSKLSRLFGAPMRFYRSRGFGIHSPFAFRMIQEVVRCPYPGYSYYAYGNIRELCRAAKLSASAGYRFYRLLVFINPAEIILSNEEEIWRQIAGLYHPFKGKGSLVVIDSPTSFTPELEQRVNGDAPCYILILNLQKGEMTKSFDALTRTIDYGMTFTNGRRALLCAVRGLPRQKYKVWI